MVCFITPVNVSFAPVLPDFNTVKWLKSEVQAMQIFVQTCSYIRILTQVYPLLLSILTCSVIVLSYYVNYPVKTMIGNFAKAFLDQ